jgi:mono/diheme cytochrome c family protein
MKFLIGFLTAFGVSALVIFLVIISGAYNVAATVPHSALERVILNSAMVYSVRAHAGKESREAWSDEQIRDGFKEYDAMCIVCHEAPGKERGDISKGLRPEPPNLADVSKEWTNAQLFWIIKNGIKMTGMPAFGPTHKDETIWNIVGFVRRLPQTSAQEYKAMEEQFGISPEYGHHH